MRLKISALLISCSCLASIASFAGNTYTFQLGDGISEAITLTNAIHDTAIPSSMNPQLTIVAAYDDNTSNPCFTNFPTLTPFATPGSETSIYAGPGTQCTKPLTSIVVQAQTVPCGSSSVALYNTNSYSIPLNGNITTSSAFNVAVVENTAPSGLGLCSVTTPGTIQAKVSGPFLLK